MLNPEHRAQNLTLKEIVDAFPDECKTMLPREIKRLRKFTREYERKKREFFNRHWDQVNPTAQLLGLLWLDIAYQVEPVWYRPVTPFSMLKRLEEIHGYFLDPPSTDPGRISDDQLARAKTIPITSLYAFQRPKRNGQRIIALCPFHAEKSGSFVIYPNNSAHCFGCGVSVQDPIAFLQKVEGLSFRDAVLRLAP